MSDEHKAGLEHLGVLIGRTRSKVGAERVFLVLDVEAPARVPESMVETQPLSIVQFPLIIGP